MHVNGRVQRGDFALVRLEVLAVVVADIDGLRAALGEQMRSCPTYPRDRVGSW